ncbi:MAG: DUF1194 domain-containing protein [Pseudomonadota bacterium]
MVDWRACLLALGLGVFADGTSASECRLALVLALDVSSSVDAKEYDLQRVGLAAALDSEDVRHAILAGGPGYVALSVFEWSGFRQHDLKLDWSILDSQSAITDAAAVLAKMQRGHDEFPTSMGAAMAYGLALLQKGPQCRRRVIDVSGDGVNNYRYGPRAAYRHFPFQEVTVNGLVILGDDPEVLPYYRTNVMHGQDAFLMTANGFDQFQDAMTRKLYREISNFLIGGDPSNGQKG